MKKSRLPQKVPHGPKQFRVKRLAILCAMLAVDSSVATAQDTQAAVADGSATVVVTGFRKSLETSIAAKRNSDSIIEVVSAEDLGKLPDSSIAEGLARLPGVTGQRGTDGRVNVISIRGLNPEFAGALLNGREIVSSNDSRAVEYDQFPSELIGSGVIYKTPDAALVGQGLSGTVDLRSRRPLDTRGREIAVNIRGERNSLGEQAPGVGSPTGKRFSISYVNQFDDNKLGIAVGFAHLESTAQNRMTQLVEYGNYSQPDFWSGIPIQGSTVMQPFTPLSEFAGADGVKRAPLLPMYFEAQMSSKSNKRDGLMAVIEYKPNKDLHSTLDLYYSKFNTTEVGGKFMSSFFGAWDVPKRWDGSDFITVTDVGVTQEGKNTYATSGTAARLPVTTGNWQTKRDDTISAIGWNTELKLNDKWSAVADLSYSKDEKNEEYDEAYAAPFDNGWSYGTTFRWNIPITGANPTWTPAQKDYLASSTIVKLGDAEGFRFVRDQPAYTGAIRTPTVDDTIKTIRLSVKRKLDGPFSAFTGGFNYTKHDKLVDHGETRLLMGQDAAGNYQRDIPAAALKAPFNFSWMGLGGLIRYDVPSLIGSTVTRQALFQNKVGDSSAVHEKISTAFAKLDIDSEVMNIPLRGNLGLQAVRSQQESEGWEYRGTISNPDINLLFKRTGGATYTDYLPSMNLIAELQPSLLARIGVGKMMARPNINQMRAGTTTPVLINDAPPPGGGAPNPLNGTWTLRYAGNPELEPWRATAYDLSLEKYFGKRSYIGVAAFRKKLTNYVFDKQSLEDNSAFPLPDVLQPGVVPQKDGPVFKPVNGEGGTVDGLEYSASIEGGLLHPMLEGFGIVFSKSNLSSDLKDDKGDQIKINGLSGVATNTTLYYERYGYSFRISERYRSPFSATTRDIFFNNVTRQQDADRVMDLQLGYSFESGTYKGLSVLLQVNNLRDSKTTSRRQVAGLDKVNSVPDPSVLLPNYIYQFGRQTLLGVNYKF